VRERRPFIHGDLRRRRSPPSPWRARIAGLARIDLCAICGAYIPASARRCPGCLAVTRVRRERPEATSRRMNLALAGLALVFVLAAATLVVELALSGHIPGFETETSEIRASD
jgi:predicted nucleic acid-binding Zn ribbon protein